MMKSKISKKYGIDWIKPINKIESKTFDIMKELEIGNIKVSK